MPPARRKKKGGVKVLDRQTGTKRSLTSAATRSILQDDPARIQLPRRFDLNAARRATTQIVQEMRRAQDDLDPELQHPERVTRDLDASDAIGVGDRMNLRVLDQLVQSEDMAVSEDSGVSERLTSFGLRSFTARVPGVASNGFVPGQGVVRLGAFRSAMETVAMKIFGRLHIPTGTPWWIQIEDDPNDLSDDLEENESGSEKIQRQLAGIFTAEGGSTPTGEGTQPHYSTSLPQDGPVTRAAIDKAIATINTKNPTGRIRIIVYRAPEGQAGGDSYVLPTKFRSVRSLWSSPYPTHCGQLSLALGLLIKKVPRVLDVSSSAFKIRLSKIRYRYKKAFAEQVALGALPLHRTGLGRWASKMLGAGLMRKPSMRFEDLEGVARTHKVEIVVISLTTSLVVYNTGASFQETGHTITLALDEVQQHFLFCGEPNALLGTHRSFCRLCKSVINNRSRIPHDCSGRMCRCCLVTFSSVESLEKHKQDIREAEPVRCERCNFSLPEICLEGHQKKCKGRVITCDTCGERYQCAPASSRLDAVTKEEHAEVCGRRYRRCMQCGVLGPRSHRCYITALTPPPTAIDAKEDRFTLDDTPYDELTLSRRESTEDVASPFEAHGDGEVSQGMTSDDESDPEGEWTPEHRRLQQKEVRKTLVFDIESMHDVDTDNDLPCRQIPTFISVREVFYPEFVSRSVALEEMRGNEDDEPIYDLDNPMPNGHVMETVSHFVQRSRDLHDQNGVLASFQGEDCVHQFCEWVNTTCRSTTLVAHNLRGYDGYFLMDTFVNTMGQGVHPVLNGMKVMMLTTKEGNNCFIDSLNHLQVTLSGMPKLMGISHEVGVGKDFFPHDFNVPDNYDYTGPLPHRRFFEEGRMSEQRRHEFEVWYEETEAKFRDSADWNLRDVEAAYCHQDTFVLAMCVGVYIRNFMVIHGLNPLRSPTTAGFCMRVYRSRFLPSNTDTDIRAEEQPICVLTDREEVFARKAFHGGRTEVFKPLVIEQDMHYVDVQSLYPSVQYYDIMPSGAPVTYVVDSSLDGMIPIPKRATDITRTFRVSRDGMLLGLAQNVHLFTEHVCGFAEVDFATRHEFVHDPDFIPAIGAMQDGKYIFGTGPANHVVVSFHELRQAWDTIVITRVYRMDVYHGRYDLFRGYVRHGLKGKIESSKPPSDIDDTVRRHKDRLGIDLDRERCLAPPNPGLRALHKLNLNSLWGKFGQRELGMCVFAKPDEFHQLVAEHMAKNILIKHIDIDPEVRNMIAIRYVPLKASNRARVSSIVRDRTNVAVAAYVAASARVRLQTVLLDEKLKGRVVYCDTDSVIYLDDPTKENNVEEGDMLGDWEEEHANPQRSLWNHFVGLAPKTYAIEDRRPGEDKPRDSKIRAKGFHSNGEILSFDSMRALQESVSSRLEDRPAISMDMFTMRRLKRFKGITADTLTKRLVYQPESGKRLLTADGRLVPRCGCVGKETGPCRCEQQIAPEELDRHEAYGELYKIMRWWMGSHKCEEGFLPASQLRDLGRAAMSQMSDRLIHSDEIQHAARCGVPRIILLHDYADPFTVADASCF